MKSLKKKIIILFCFLLTGLIITPTAISVNNQISKSIVDGESKTVEKETNFGKCFLANVNIEGDGYIIKEGPFAFFKITEGNIELDFVIGEDITLQSGKGFFFGYFDKTNEDNIKISGFSLVGYIENI